MNDAARPYGIDQSDHRIVAWSDTRLPFEPRSWLVEFRDRLRAAVRAMKPVEGQLLRATYASPGDGFADVENVLLYNLGSGAYAHLAGTGIECRRVRSHDDKHRVVYEVGGGEDSLYEGPVLARAGIEVLRRSEKAGAWWAAFRPRMRREVADVHADEYVVQVELGRAWQRRGLVAAIKPMLDGLISALHVHDGSAEAQVRSALAAYGDGAVLWDQLNNPDVAVLGQRKLVRPHGSGIAWNPADERCSAFSVAYGDGNAAVTAVVRAGATRDAR